MPVLGDPASARVFIKHIILAVNAVRGSFDPEFRWEGECHVLPSQTQTSNSFRAYGYSAK